MLCLRTGERSFDLIAPTDQGIYPLGESNLYRDLREWVESGDEFEAPGFHLTIGRVEEGRVLSVHVELDAPLADLRLVNETDDEYALLTLPPPGFGMPLDSEPPDE